MRNLATILALIVATAAPALAQQMPHGARDFFAPNRGRHRASRRSHRIPLIFTMRIQRYRYSEIWRLRDERERTAITIA